MASPTFGAWLDARLRHARLNQREFAERIGVSQSTVSRWLRNERLPESSNCDAIADVLVIPLDDVLAMAGHRPAPTPVAPDDPRVRLHGIIDRVHWTPERLRHAEAFFSVMIEMDREASGANNANNHAANSGATVSQ